MAFFVAMLHNSTIVLLLQTMSIANQLRQEILSLASKPNGVCRYEILGNQKSSYLDCVIREMVREKILTVSKERRFTKNKVAGTNIVELKKRLVNVYRVNVDANKKH